AMSFNRLKLLAERMSGALASRAGVKQGDVVACLLPNVPHFPVLYYALARLGAALAPMPPNSVGREIQVMLSDTGTRTLVTLDLLYDRVANTWQGCGVETVIVGTVIDFMPLPVRLLARLTKKAPKPAIPVPYSERVLPMSSLLRHAAVPQRARVKTSDVALLQFTGGTTGTPKAAMLTHASLLANARQMRSWFPSLRDGEETLLAVLPFFHVYGVTLVMNAAMLLAARTVLVPRPVVQDMLDAIRTYQPTIFPGVPTIYVAITGDPRSRHYDLSSIDVCVCGGAPLPIDVKRDFEHLTGGRLYEGYGLSEASPVTHAEPCNRQSKPGSIGLPLPDTEVRIVDESGSAVPVGQVGELVIRGPQVMKGYLNRAEETAEVLVDGWLRTGDLARMDDEGWFFIVDRKKDLIITGAHNIYPREIEDVLLQHDSIHEVAVVGVPHPYGGEVAKAFIVLKPGREATKSQILAFARERLARHKVPRAIEFRDELPKSHVQKTLRRVLAQEERERQARRAADRTR
ncbi:MAG: long-chain-fatty-acid--CoA ligase, partial [Chloroflexota bacterium]